MLNDMKKRVTVLGSTGSIGTQALQVAQRLGCRITALTAHSNIKIIEEQIRQFKPALVVLYDEQAAQDLKVRIGDLPVKVLSGLEGMCEAAATDTDLVLNSIVGFAGLKPTMAAIQAGHDIALANKETLVAGGSVVMREVARCGVGLLPIDSEHSAIFQCLQGAPPDRAVKRLILTASGGPFFGKKSVELENVTPEDALRHPNWSMGAKITIDSATMMNKGLELIEARWLFDVNHENIDVIIHRESVIHSLVEYNDNSVIAQLGVPDMQIPIQYAITWPKRVESNVKSLDLTEFGKLSFYPPDCETFVCIDACRHAIERGGLVPAAVNAANEVAVDLFISRKIGFLDIGRLVCKALDYNLPGAVDNLDQILQADRAVREQTLASAREIMR